MRTWVQRKNLAAACGFVVVAIVVAAASMVASKIARPELQFNRDVRPILSDKCFRCHNGLDAAREGNLRLDRREDAIAMRADIRAIVPGKPAESELFRRITSTDNKQRMPPHESSLELTAKEIDILRRWIESGADYESHWSFVAPKVPSLPTVRQHGWSRNPIDQFVLAELEERGLAPSPTAPLSTLIRRASLDITGLPPTLSELDAATDFEAEIDRLLASPRFGERMALDWLDGARYADSNGYFKDNERRAWPWRDWVINAFNANMPFNQFTIEQLAGDLLSNPTQDQKIATAFNRNHMSSDESGLIDEEYRISYVVDRVDTTTTIWLGLTFGCARCHDHKYDPITQAEYYQFFAFFNNIVEKGLVDSPAGPQPLLTLPDDEQAKVLAALTRRKNMLDVSLGDLDKQLTQLTSTWEAELSASLPPLPTTAGLAYFNFNADSADHGPHKLAATEHGTVELVPGVHSNGAKFGSSRYVEFDVPARFDRDVAFSLAVWINPEASPSSSVVSKMDSDGNRGFEIIWYDAQPRINLVHEWGKSAIEMVPRSTYPANEWRHIAITYDGSGKAAGMRLYIDGVAQDAKIRRDDLKGTTASAEPWRIAWKGTGVGFDGSIDEFRLYDRILAAAEIESLYWRDLLSGAVATPVKERTKLQKDGLRSYYVAKHGTKEQKDLFVEAAALKVAETQWHEKVVAVPVMHEMDKPRETNVLVRGQYDQPGSRVTAGVPTILGNWPWWAPKNRLGLAQWIVAPENPLTARVIVNRYWQLVFGEGLVRTPNDFGLQGEYPTHPELLDWLAVEFVKSGWNVKALLRLMLTSSTYRQSSRFTPELLARDPENRLLARGALYRLGAEQIRDQALAIGGLLADRRGGPSVKPYQPAGLWEAVSYNGDQSYQQDHGEALYRRTMYTYWKRQAPPPSVLIFDGPTRELCTVQRPRTNTPLQALALLNDVTYIEAARGLAARTLRERENRIAFAFRLCTGRVPTDTESANVQNLLDQQLAAYRARPAAAMKLLRVGESPVDPALDSSELAAWTTVASVLLNLDETITQH